MAASGSHGQVCVAASGSHGQVYVAASGIRVFCSPVDTHWLVVIRTSRKRKLCKRCQWPATTLALFWLSGCHFAHYIHNSFSLTFVYLFHSCNKQNTYNTNRRYMLLYRLLIYRCINGLVTNTQFDSELPVQFSTFFIRFSF